MSSWNRVNIQHSTKNLKVPGSGVVVDGKLKAIPAQARGGLTLKWSGASIYIHRGADTGLGVKGAR